MEHVIKSLFARVTSLFAGLGCLDQRDIAHKFDRNVEGRIKRHTEVNVNVTNIMRKRSKEGGKEIANNLKNFVISRLIL